MYCYNILLDNKRIHTEHSDYLWCDSSRLDMIPIFRNVKKVAALRVMKMKT